MYYHQNTGKYFFDRIIINNFCFVLKSTSSYIYGKIVNYTILPHVMRSLQFLNSNIIKTFGYASFIFKVTYCKSHVEICQRGMKLVRV